MPSLQRARDEVITPEEKQHASDLGFCVLWDEIQVIGYTVDSGSLLILIPIGSYR